VRNDLAESVEVTAENPGKAAGTTEAAEATEAAEERVEERMEELSPLIFPSAADIFKTRVKSHCSSISRSSGNGYRPGSDVVRLTR
jgi:hypothetical protein